MVHSGRIRRMAGLVVSVGRPRILRVLLVNRWLLLVLR